MMTRHARIFGRIQSPPSLGNDLIEAGEHFENAPAVREIKCYGDARTGERKNALSALIAHNLHYSQEGSAYVRGG